MVVLSQTALDDGSNGAAQQYDNSRADPEPGHRAPQLAGEVKEYQEAQQQHRCECLTCQDRPDLVEEAAIQLAAIGFPEREH